MQFRGRIEENLFVCALLHAVIRGLYTFWVLQKRLKLVEFAPILAFVKDIDPLWVSLIVIDVLAIVDTRMFR